MKNKKPKLKWWNVDCVLTQYFTIGLDGKDVQDALDSTRIEYKNGNIDTEKEDITYTTFDIKAVRPMRDEGK